MADIQDFKEAAEILQSVDVSEIFTSLALGIATAQQKLDENSIKQVIKLSETKIIDKSLLELGFTPAFYSFKEATISASINLKMAQKDNFSINVSLSASYSKSNNLTKEQTDFVNDDKYAKGNEDNKCGKSVVFKVSETGKVKVEGTEIEFSAQDKGKDKECVKMIEDYEDTLKKISKITEIETEVCSGFVQTNTSKGLNVTAIKNNFACISIPHQLQPASPKYYALKVTQFDNKEVDLGETKKLKVEDNFVKTLTNLKANLKAGTSGYAFSNDGKFYDCGVAELKAVDLAVSFKPGNEKVAGRIDWEKSKALISVFKKLVYFTQRAKEKVNITITGESENEKLAENQAKVLSGYLKNLGINATITPAKKTGKGNNASVSLDMNCIIFENALEAMTYPDETPVGNKFLEIKAAEAAVESMSIKRTEKEKEIELKIPVKTDLKEVEKELANEENKKQYLFELGKDEILYVLDKGTLIKFYLFSKENNIAVEEVKDKDKKEESGEGKEKEEKVLVKDEFNKESKLKDSLPDKESSTFAIGGSIDIRYSRQFEMSMEGNSYMSATMVALPPPEEFKRHVIDNYLKGQKNGGTGES